VDATYRAFSPLDRRDRYATTELLVASPWSMIGGCLVFVPFIALAHGVAWSTPSWPAFGFAALATMFFGGLMCLAFTQWYSGRIVELRIDGIAIGPRRACTRVIPWQEISAVRRDIAHGKTEGLEIVEEDGTRTLLHQNYGRSFDALADAIAPSWMSAVAALSGRPLRAGIRTRSGRPH
jgi:hypothetical protein